MGNYRRNFVTGAKKLATGLLVVGLFCVFFNTLQTQQARAVTTTPTKMNFQGRLADASGITMPNGTYNMRLKLYTVLSGGTAAWSEDRLVSGGTGVAVANGQFSIQLGDVTTLPASLFASGNLYLEVELPTPATATTSSPSWAEGAMTPRNILATSAYAFNSETLDGIDSDSFAQIGKSNTFKNDTNSTLAFSIQTSSGSKLLTADTTNANIVIGDSTSDATAIFLAVDSYNGGSDPAGGFNGAIYYNSSLNKLRCYENGVWKDCISSSGPVMNVVKLSSDVVNSETTANTLIDAGNLSFDVEAGKIYRLETFIEYSSAATSTGSRWVVNGPASSKTSFESRYANSATAEVVYYSAGYNLPSAISTGSVVATNIARIQGRIRPTASGTVQIRFASEIASSAITARAGSTLTWWEE